MSAVLVVDDRPADRLAVCAALEALGCELDVAMTGEQALARAAARDYACMIVDLRLPTIDGITTATRLRAIERARETPVILMSSDTPTAADEQQFIGAGIIDFLPKPLDIDELRARVSALLAAPPVVAPRVVPTAERLSRLQAVTEALSRALSPAAVAAVVLEHGVRAMGADTCLVYTAVDGDLSLLGHHGLPPAVASALAAIRRLDEMPGLAALRDGRPVFTETHAEYCATFPVLAERSPMGGPQAAWAVPLVAAGTPVGVIAMGYLEERAFAPEERDFITTFARQCAFALERTRLYEQQRANIEQLRALAEEARAAVRARDDFLSDASHELNTPLAAVKLQVGRLLRRPPPPEEMLERLAVIDKQVDRLAVLVHELLDVSRLRAGRFELERTDTDLAALVRDVAERLDSTRLVLSLAPARGHWDQSRLEQVLTNLMSNALKYGENRPVEVVLERSHRSDEVVFTVRDQGIGVAEQDQARIFDRFERAASGQRFSGLGLGLWISRRIIEAHGGTIAVESRVGQGATFTVRLPLG